MATEQYDLAMKAQKLKLRTLQFSLWQVFGGWLTNVYEAARLRKILSKATMRILNALLWRTFYCLIKNVVNEMRGIMNKTRIRMLQGTFIRAFEYWASRTAQNEIFTQRANLVLMRF